MSGIDYESEYDNRGRVKEHPALIAGWARDATAYRTTAGHAVLDIAYGATERSRYDLFAAHGDRRGPLAAFVHGGYWRALDKSYFSHMAAGLNPHGVDVAVIGYDLCPSVSLGAIVDQIRAALLHLWREHGRRITVFGHSAGGHATACAVATDFRALGAGAPGDLAPCGYGISGLYDLVPLCATSHNEALQLSVEDARRLSPLGWRVAAGRLFDAVVGGAESAEYHRQSRDLAEAWSALGVEAREDRIAGADHFTILAPLADPSSAMTARLLALVAHTERIDEAA